ncbi:MAG TPA: oxidoreductase [Pseudonocardiaceae bacterium]
MTPDPLRPLLDLPGVTDAVAAARDAVATVHRHPANRHGWPTTAAEASVRAARASAALSGGTADIPADGAVTDPVLAGALRVAEAIGPLLTTWQRAPLQALARLHLLAAADLPAADLGRPRATPGVTGRLDLLAQLIAGGTTAPAPVLAAVVHGELLTLAPFGTADGVVARAAARLTLIATGLDPKGLIVPEVAYLRRRDHYGDIAAGFASGSAAGVAAWLVFCCEAITTGAREATGIADAATT